MMLGLSLALTSSAVLRRASPVPPPWVPAGAAIVADFANNRYWSQPGSVYSSFAAFATAGHAEFTRASAAWWSNGAAVPKFAAGVIRRIDGVGALLLSARTRLSPAPLGLNASPWNTAGTGVTRTALDPLGDFPVPVRITSGGGQDDSVGIYNRSWTGDIAVRARYRAGTSGLFRILVRDTSAGLNTVVQGSVGSLAATSQAGGDVSDLVNTSLGDGLFEVALRVSLVAASDAWSVRMGPGATTAGNTVDILGAQVVAGAAPSEWIFGDPGEGVAVAADELTLNPPGPDALNWTIAYDNDSAQVIPAHTGPLTINPTRPTIKQIIAEAA